MLCSFPIHIQRTFYKVWHPALLSKIKTNLPRYFLLFKSYLYNRWFYIRHGFDISESHLIKSGVPQGSVLGPVLYTLYTADLPIKRDVTTTLAAHQDPEIASKILQRQFSDIQTWLDKWRIKASQTKSVHITLTTRKGNCPTANLYDWPLPSVNEVKYLGMYLDRD